MSRDNVSRLSQDSPRTTGQDNPPLLEGVSVPVTVPGKFSKRRIVGRSVSRGRGRQTFERRLRGLLAALYRFARARVATSADRTFAAPAIAAFETLLVDLHLPPVGGPWQPGSEWEGRVGRGADHGERTITARRPRRQPLRPPHGGHNRSTPDGSALRTHPLDDARAT